MSEYNEGDLIEAVKGEDLIRGRLDGNGGSPGLRVGPGFYHLSTLSASGFTITVIEKAAPKLPTDPGIYVSWNESPSPKIVHKVLHGRWVDADDTEYLTEETVSKLMPLTRLEPVPVTAKKVIDRVANFWEFGPPRNIADELNQIAKEFGGEA